MGLPFPRSVAAIFVSLALAGCVSAERPPATSGPTASVLPSASASPSAGTDDGTLTGSVDLGDHFYSPERLTVTVGTTVVWRVVGQQTHDVWAFDGSFRSPTLGPGDAFSHTFTEPGSYRYFCSPHAGDGMYGEIVVEQRRAP